MSKTDHSQQTLTIGDTIFTSSGNILFNEGEEGSFVLAESQLLNNFDNAIEHGILENGMQMLMKKFKA